MAVNLPPGLVGYEGQLVRGHADDVAVLVVEGLGPSGLQATTPVDGVGDNGSGSDLGAGEVAQRVEEDVVYGGDEGVGHLVVYCYLYFLLDFESSGHVTSSRAAAPTPRMTDWATAVMMACGKGRSSCEA